MVSGIFHQYGDGGVVPDTSADRIIHLRRSGRPQPIARTNPKIALDPYLRRHLSLEELPRKVTELGYEYIKLSPRDDFLARWVNPPIPLPYSAKPNLEIEVHRVGGRGLFRVPRLGGDLGVERVIPKALLADS
jgi:hypothetical protein